MISLFLLYAPFFIFFALCAFRFQTLSFRAFLRIFEFQEVSTGEGLLSHTVGYLYPGSISGFQGTMLCDMKMS